MTTRLHGRSGEQRGIDLLTGAARSDSGGALVLSGAPGIGKSALLEYAVAAAGSMRILRCGGDQGEAGLPHAALHRLLQPVLPFVLELGGRMAPPLAAALGLEVAEASAAPVGAALLELLTTLARRRPLLCVVDDAQWLDPPTAEALSFVARRLHRAAVALLIAVRDSEGRPFRPAGVDERRLAALDALAASRLLADHAGPRVAPEVARRLVAQTAGIPLALVGATGSLTPAQLTGRASLPQPLPLTPGVRSALLRPVRALPRPAQRLLVVIAAAGAERIDVVAAAGAGLGVDLCALDDAQASALVSVEEGTVRLASPLVRSAVYHDAPFAERRAVHSALAGALGAEDDARRLRHLAAAALAPDWRLAAALERSAEGGGGHGRLPANANALQRAAELTPDGPERARRLVAAASAHWRGGRASRAAELLERAGRLRLAPLLDADLAALRGRIALSNHDPGRAVASLTAGADRVAAACPVRALDLLVQAGAVLAAGSDAAAASGLARRAGALPGGPTEGAALLDGLAQALGGRFDETAALAERAISRAVDAGERAPHLVELAASLCAGGDLAPASMATALSLLAGEVSRLRAAGAAGELPGALASLAWLELWADRHRSCFADASEGLASARALGQRWAEARCAVTLAVLSAIRGDEAGPADGRAVALHAAAATWAAALADLGAGRFGEALGRLDHLAPGGRLSHPCLTLWSRPDAVEAAVRCGQPEAARAALDALEAASLPSWPAPAAALLARGRALVAEGEEAERHYRAAVELHQEDERPFQHARTRLLWGRHLRRSRRRLEAREQLRSALETFDRLEARPWAARAIAELRATGEAVRRGRGNLDGLTRREVRIAELVARGGSNREVAEQLFLSPRTVGYHLARIYQKLGVASRTRLAHLVLEEQPAAPGA